MQQTVDLRKFNNSGADIIGLTLPGILTWWGFFCLAGLTAGVKEEGRRNPDKEGHASPILDSYKC